MTIKEEMLKLATDSYKQGGLDFADSAIEGLSTQKGKEVLDDVIASLYAMRAIINA